MRRIRTSPTTVRSRYAAIKHPCIRHPNRLYKPELQHTFVQESVYARTARNDSHSHLSIGGRFIHDEPSASRTLAASVARAGRGGWLPPRCLWRAGRHRARPRRGGGHGRPAPVRGRRDAVRRLVCRHPVSTRGTVAAAAWPASPASCAPAERAPSSARTDRSNVAESVWKP